jgi:hypothetical protein
MNDSAPAYGLWFLIINSRCYFAFSFTRRAPRDGDFGAFSALSLLAAEMYGFHDYLLPGLGSRCQARSSRYRTPMGALLDGK